MMNWKIFTKILGEQRGAALITVLLIATLATIMAVSLATTQQLDIRRTANMVNGDQAYIYAQSVESWGVQVLIRDGAQGKIDNLAEDWALGLPFTEVEGGGVSGYIEDMQFRFNVNNLAPGSPYEAIAFKHMENLLEKCDIYLDVLDDVVEWLDADSVSSRGAEDDYYLQLEVGYRTANKLTKDVSELRLVRGVDKEGYECLYPYITALPDATKVNVNTASAEVLAALDSSLDEEKVTEFVESRPDKGYASINNFYVEADKFGLDFQSILGIGQYLDIQSSYFMGHATGIVGQDRPMTVNLDSLLYRDQQSNIVEVLNRVINR
jgi:general secretion pathway protein K